MKTSKAQLAALRTIRSYGGRMVIGFGISATIARALERRGLAVVTGQPMTQADLKWRGITPQTGRVALTKAGAKLVEQEG